jgi:predicted methyltransferase
LKLAWVVAAALWLAFPSAAPSESPALPENQIPAPIREAVASPERPDADRQLDAGRQPEQMLAFFGIAPGQKVADMYAGGGYTTELLARVVGPTGLAYSQIPVFPPELKQIGEAWAKRVSRLPNVFPIQKSLTDPKFLPAPDDSLDAVLINMNYHDLVLQKLDRDKFNAEVFRALRRGGVYGIVDHSAKPGSGDAALELHRIDQDFVTKEVEKAGFKLGAASSALRHPDDDRTWSTSPRVVGEKRGTSDRFMLRFVKP